MYIFFMSNVKRSREKLEWKEKEISGESTVDIMDIRREISYNVGKVMQR